MLAIWASLIRSCEERARIPHRAGTRTADEEVRLGLSECMERACADCEHRAAQNDEPIPPNREELARWAPSGACMVNNMAALLGHSERYLEIPEREGSEPMRRMLAECLRQLRHDAREGMRGALPTFARRTLGYSPTGESVRWNPETLRFENVPWPLQSETRDNAPQGATRVAPRGKRRRKAPRHLAPCRRRRLPSEGNPRVRSESRRAGSMASQNAGVRPTRGRRGRTHQRLAGTRPRRRDRRRAARTGRTATTAHGSVASPLQVPGARKVARARRTALGR